MEKHSEHGNHKPASPAGGYSPGEHAMPGGLSLAANGLRFVPAETWFELGVPATWTFEIVDGNGDIVTVFEESHGELAHLILVRRDLTEFQHLHPTLEADGTWRIEDLTFSEPGVYRAFVDVVVENRPTTLGHDVFVPGEMPAKTRPAASRQAQSQNYEIELRTDEIAAGDHTPLTFDIRDNDERVPQLKPYLGAFGHLVALRDGDLAYLHIHPEETDPESGRVEFSAQFPTPGRYRLFLQVKPDGHLITSSFDIEIDR